MTEVLLGLIFVTSVGGGIAAIVLLRMVRNRLDRRLKRIERRLEELVASSSTDAVVAELESVRTALTNQGAELRQAVRDGVAPLRSGKHSVEQRTRRAVTQDVHALFTLHSNWPLNAESLALTGYAAAPDTLLHLTTLIEELPDGALVVEVGSGLSTIWMAAAARRSNRSIRIVSVDHEARWGEETAAALARLQLGEWCEVRVAPLTPLPGSAHEETPWYDLSGFDDLDEISLLVVDGPPAATGPQARYPALPQLHDRLAPGVVIVLDDTDRPEEQEILARWVSELEREHTVNLTSRLERTTIMRVARRDE